MKKVLLALVVFTAASLSASAANLVTNGDFSAACVTNSSASNAIPGWIASGNDASLCQPGTPNLGAGNPGQWAELNAGPGALVTLTQTITGLTVGTEYVLSWDNKSGFACCGSTTVPGVGASINGVTVLNAIGNNTTWTNYSFAFNATSTSEVLTLESQANSTDTDAGFDNVSIVVAPEPTSFLLMGAAGLGLMAFRRLRLS